MLSARNLVRLGLGFVPTVSALAEPVSPRAHAIVQLGPLPISNTMVTSWVVAAVVIIAIRWAIGRRPQLRPSKGQVVVETLVQGVLDLTTPIVGKRAARATFPLLVGLFTFILMQNWSGEFPGVGTVMIRDPHTGLMHDFVRPGNTDLNLPFALATVSFFAWLYFIVRYAGFKAIIQDIFGNKATKGEVPFILYLLLYILFFLIGIIEIISIMFRPVSLSLRLFGNMFGGENLMHSITELAAWTRWVLPVPITFLEILVGFVQALVFTLLVSVYIGLICNHEGHDGHHDEAAHAHGHS